MSPLAATLGFIVAVTGLRTPLLVVLVFIPMFLAAWATKQMNAADPDCGTRFTWAARAIGPKTGWFAGGWGTQRLGATRLDRSVLELV